MRKIALLLCLVLTMVCAAAAEEPSSGDYSYELLEDGTAIITNYAGSESTVTVPTELDGYQVSAISDWAFGDCEALNHIIIPDTVVTVGCNPFYYCPNLNCIEVSLEHPTLAVIDGVLFYKPEKILLCYPAGLAGEEYAIPQGITQIEDNAFHGAVNLVSVMIPGSVEIIGGSAFDSCINLVNVTISEGVAVIGAYAFDDCNALRTIALPDSVTTLYWNPFARCPSLESITVSLEHPTLAVIDGALFSKTDKRLIVYPCMLQGESYAVPQGITKVEDHAFYGSKLSSIVIPDSVTEIGTGTFECCELLTAINIPASATTFGEYIFSGCPLVTVTLTRNSALVPKLKEDGVNYTYLDLYDWLNN